MWTTGRNLLELFYPRRCLLCSQLLAEEEQQMCLHCFCDLPRTCYYRRTEHPMQRIYAGIPQIQDMNAFLFFERDGKSQTLIHSLKYYGNKRLAEKLGRMASLEMKPAGVFSGIDVLIPVPLHPKKERKRGYNQSEWIARGMASVYQRPVDRQVLFRRVATDTQTRRSRYERHLNVEKIFDVKETHTLAGKHVLLIDDVITTGATSIACIEALTAIPDIRISVFALTVIPMF
jgi:ComF family protein